MRHQRLPISQAEFDALINGSVKHSIETFSKLTGFASSGACLPDQYLRMVAMMYDQLDASKIPSGIIEQGSTCEDLDLVFASLVGIGVSFPIWLNHNAILKKLVGGLSAHWPDIRRWILYLHQNVIVKEGLDLTVRYTCKTSVIEFLGLVRDRLLLSWSKSIPTDREVMRMICNLWFIETRDRRFSSWTENGNNQRESAVFNACFLVAHETGVPVDWENLLDHFHGEPELVATVSLCHLDREISHSNELDLNCIAWDLHIVTMFSFHELIRLALMRQGMIKAAAEILEYVVDRTWVGSKRVLAARCMINAIVILRSRIQDLDAFPFLVQALDRGLIKSLLKCEALLPFTEQLPAYRQPLMLFDILLGYTVYRSILHPISLAVSSDGVQELENKLIKGGEISKAWKRLKDAVEERRKLMRRDVANWHIQSCQNQECSRVNYVTRFKRCGGCLHSYYCSRKCQRYDWRKGQHKEYCLGIQYRFARTLKQMSAVRGKELKFLDQVILTELRKHTTRFSAHTSKLTLVDLNLVGQANIIFDARGMNANPFGIKCGCEIFANLRWKHMVQVAREGKKPVVIVRAFIPGGCSRKIVLQMIPLSVLLEEKRKSRVVERYQCNLIFTCCGDQGNEPGALSGVKIARER